MVDVVQAIQSAIEIVGRLRNLSKKIDEAEFRMLLADLSGDLADAKVEVAALKVEIARLTEQNQELAARLAQRASATTSGRLPTCRPIQAFALWVSPRDRFCSTDSINSPQWLTDGCLALFASIRTTRPALWPLLSLPKGRRPRDFAGLPLQT